MHGPARVVVCVLALAGCGRGFEPEPERVEGPRLAQGSSASEPTPIELPTLAPVPAAPPARAVAPIEAPKPAVDEAPKPAVDVELVRILGPVDTLKITRLMDQLATRCHARAPALTGRMTLKFVLFGNYKGPTAMNIQTTGGAGQLGGCMRREMAASRWPTGLLCGTGEFEVRLRFGK